MARDSVNLTINSRANKARDLAFRETRVLQAIEKYCIEYVEGGHTFEYPALVRDHTDIIVLSGRGDARIDSEPKADVSEYFSYTNAMAAKNVVAYKKELMENAGPDRRVDLWAARTERTMKDFMRSFDKYLLHYDSTDTSGVKLANSNFGTFDGVNTTTGFLEENAEGAQSNAVGSLSRTTYTDLRNRIWDIGSSFATVGIAKFALASAETDEYVGDKRKQVMFISPTMWSKYLTETAGNILLAPEGTRDVLAGSVLIANMQTVMTSNLGWTGGGAAVSGAIVNFNNYTFRTTRDGFFKAQPQERLSTQLGSQFPIILYGQLMCIDNQRGSGLILNGEA